MRTAAIVAGIVVGVLALAWLVSPAFKAFDATPLNRLEARARALVGQPKAVAVPELDALFDAIGPTSKTRKDCSPASSKTDLAREVESMSWRPVPPPPQDEEVICYIVKWNAVFFYIGPDGRVTRVWKSGT